MWVAFPLDCVVAPKIPEGVFFAMIRRNAQTPRSYLSIYTSDFIENYTDLVMEKISNNTCFQFPITTV